MATCPSVLMLLAAACASPNAAAPPPSATTAPAVVTVTVIVTPAPPTSLPQPTTALPPTALIVTPPATIAPGATVPVPAAAATAVAQASAVASPVAGTISRALGDLPTADGAIAMVETRAAATDSGVVTPMELQFELADHIGSPDVLRQVVAGVQALPGVVAVKSDGVHMLIQYDDSRIQPTQVRQLLTELGHAAAPGTDVPSPGRAAD
jgi:hypothetical protein